MGSEMCIRDRPRVTLRHDYEVRAGVLPYEFTTYVYASPIPCRARRSS